MSPRHGPTTPSSTWPGLHAAPPGPGRSPGWPVPAVRHEPPPRRGGVGWFAGGAVAAVAIVLAGAGVLAATSDPHQPLTTADVTLTVTAVATTCAPKAGCDVTYRVTATWPQNLDPATRYQVTYDLRGATGPITRTLTVQGTTYSGPVAGVAETRTRDGELTAGAVSVERI